MLALTGAYSAWLLAGSRDALTDTSYGQTLIAKLAIIVPVLALAAVNLLIFGPRFRRGDGHGATGFRRSVTIEAVLVVAVLLTVGRFVGLQPAVDAAQDTASAGIETQLDLSGHAGELEIVPGTPGPNTYTLMAPDASDDPAVEVLLRMTPPGEETALNEIDLVRQADGSFSGAGAELGLAGDWTIDDDVRQIGAFQWQATAPVAIETAVSAGDPVATGWRFDGRGAAGMVVLALAIVCGVAGALTGGRQRWRIGAASAITGVFGVLMLGIGNI